FDGTTEAIDLGPWGSGEIELSDSETLANHETIAVTTKGYHEGGRLDLKQPVDFTAFGADPMQTQLIIVAKAEGPEEVWPYGGYGLPGAAPMMPGGMPGAGMAPRPGMMPGAGMPPGMAGGMMMPGGGGFGTAAVSQPPEPIDRIRVVLVTDKGQLSSGGLMLDPNLAFEDDWLRLSAVLSDFARPEDLQGATLQRVVITGNHEGTIFVGDLKIIQEDTPLVANIEGATIRTVSAGQSTQFRAKPQDEGVRASYQWDFDDLNGLGIDGYGEEVSHQFPEAGYYVVTLRVTDPNGQLQPRMDTVKVKVE
ncbi:MAG: PKD domain-containing protein, partial [Armatimonadetes bacterium]|nr:PKD domain-containing protein [Armatimonadota bacterium]